MSAKWLSGTRFLFLLLFCAVGTGAPNKKIAVTKVEAPLYAAGSATSRVIGRLPRGTRVLLTTAAINGLIQVEVMTQSSRKMMGWIRVIQLEKAPPSPARPRAPKKFTTSSRNVKITRMRRPPNLVVVSEKVVMLSPAAFNAATAATKTTDLGFTLAIEYALRLSSSLWGGLQFTYLSLSSDYLLSSFGLSARLIYFVVDESAFSVGVFGGIGASNSSLTSPLVSDAQSLGSTRVKTMPILSFPIQGGVTLRVPFNPWLGVSVDGGYEINSLGSIPYARNADDSLLEAPFSANAAFVTLGLSLAFD